MITRTNYKKGRSTAMGMAASQARFLGLTARKSNVEFEGQQINQQRTTLSNQSANYYNDLLGMSVPTPPSVDDYTKTVYTFEDGALTNQITAMIAQTDGTYTVSYLRQWTDDFSVVSASTSIVNKQTDDDGNTTYSIGANTLRTLGEIDLETYYYLNGTGAELTAGTNEVEIDGKTYHQYCTTDDEGNTISYYMTTDDEGNTSWIDSEYNATDSVQTGYRYTGDDAYLSSLSSDQLDSLIKEEQEYLELLRTKYSSNNPNEEYMVRYIQDSTTGEYIPYFYKVSNLQNATYDANGNSQSSINCYTVGSETKTEELKAIDGCKLEKDSSGRYINITIPDESGNAITYALTTNTTTDQDAYNDAMNQYEYEKAEYDQAINEINSKIEIIQSQDKNLELRLKQLDTEQNAIQTEVDAVSKVIEKNTESSFKTFG